MLTLHRKASTEPWRVLVRDADASDTDKGLIPEEWRGLSPLGRVQAAQLVIRLGALPIQRVLCSPALRCRQTIVPLARELALEVELCRDLRCGADPAALARFLADPETSNAVLCTHRETLLGLFGRYAATGPRFIDGITDMEAAATWELRGGPEGTPRIRYLWPDSRNQLDRTGSRVARIW